MSNREQIPQVAHFWAKTSDSLGKPMSEYPALNTSHAQNIPCTKYPHLHTDRQINIHRGGVVKVIYIIESSKMIIITVILYYIVDITKRPNTKHPQLLYCTGYIYIYAVEI